MKIRDFKITSIYQVVAAVGVGFAGGSSFVYVKSLNDRQSQQAVPTRAAQMRSLIVEIEKNGLTDEREKRAKNLLNDPVYKQGLSSRENTEARIKLREIVTKGKRKL